MLPTQIVVLQPPTIDNAVDTRFPTMKGTMQRDRDNEVTHVSHPNSLHTS